MSDNDTTTPHAPEEPGAEAAQATAAEASAAEEAAAEERAAQAGAEAEASQDEAAEGADEAEGSDDGTEDAGAYAASDDGSEAASEESDEAEASEDSDASDESESSDEDEYEEIELPETPDHKRTHPAPAHLAIDRLDDDETFRFRPEGDVAALAMDIARLGQLFPVDVRLKPPDRFQLITGFRRVAALKFLQREKVLARLHVDLSDDDAALIALASAIHSQPVTKDELVAMRERLEARGRLSAAARDMLEKALAEDEGLAPELVGGDEEEVDADELAADVTVRLGQINQDLSLLADVFADLDEGRRTTLLEQLKYSSQLVDFLEGKGEGEEES